MTEPAEELKHRLSQLSARERADIAHFLIHSLDDERDADVETAWEAELERRMAQILNGEAIGEPAEKVFSDLREKYSCSRSSFTAKRGRSWTRQLPFMSAGRKGLGGICSFWSYAR
jgi:putative addiction module component (TIGR02574 family)